MKNFRYILFTFLLFAQLSCSDFLEEDPRSQITTGNFYNTIGDATKALVGSYNYLGPLYQSLGIAIVTDLSADVLDRGAGAGGSQALVFDDFTQDASSGVVRDAYEGHYVLINSVNTLLDAIEGKSLGSGNQQIVIESEAKFLRALAYFNLVRVFGPVPLKTTSTTSIEGLDLERSSEESIYALIVGDLTFAANNLPEASASPGRINQVAANTLLAKVYLTLQDYDNAISTLELVIGKRTLYQNYSDNFILANENNTVESIFEIQYGLRPENSNIVEFLTPDNVTGHGFVFGVFKAEDDLVESFEDNDTRSDISFWNQSGEIVFDGFFVRKFNDALLPGVQATDAGQINFPLLRYSDVLLMYAEALNARDSGPSEEAYEAVNAVRDRANLDDLPLGLSQTAFEEAVLEERKKEFVGEGHRWFDLKRTGKLSEKLGSKGFVAGKHDFWPIPQAAIDANPSLTQNGGY